MQNTTLERYTEFNKWGLKDSKGNLVVNCIYDNILEVKCSDGYPTDIFWVSLNGKEGIIDGQNHQIIPLEYECIDIIYDGYFACCKNGVYGVLDLEGKVILDYQYSEITEHTDGLFWVSDGDFYGLVDKNNQIVMPIEYDSIDYAYPGTYVVLKDSLYLLVDIHGKSILKKGYNEITCLSDGTIYLKDGKTNLYTTLQHLDTIHKCKSDKNGVYSSNGKTIFSILRTAPSSFNVSAGVENLALLSGYKNPEPNTAYAIKKLIFEKGVTRIQEGWQSPVYNGNGEKFDIFLPSTIKHISPNAFCDAVDNIHAIYAPSESLREIEVILPAHLRPLLKEQGSWHSVIAAWKEATPAQWYLTPISTLSAPFEALPYKTLMEIIALPIVLLPVLIFAFGIWGYSKTFSASLFGFFILILASLLLGVCYFLWAKHKYPLKRSNAISSATDCILAGFFAGGIIIALTFGLNKYFTIGDQQVVESQVKDVIYYKKGNGAILSIPFAPYQYEKRVGKDDPAIGAPVRIHYHKGYLGILVEDDVEFYSNNNGSSTSSPANSR